MTEENKPGNKPEEKADPQQTAAGCGILIFLILMAFGACSMFSSNKGSGGSNSVAISRAQMGDAYPFTVDGELRCVAPSSVIFVANGTTYGVNGTAKGHGYPGIDPIWRDDVRVPGTKINVGSVIQQGLELCK